MGTKGVIDTLEEQVARERKRFMEHRANKTTNKRALTGTKLFEKGVWLHITVMAKRRELRLAERNQKGTLVKFRRNALRSFSSKYATVAIELDFR